MPLLGHFRIVRASLGAMSTRDDVEALAAFLQRTFVDHGVDTAKTLLRKREYGAQVREEDRDSEDTLVSL